ncbi:MAG TPA: glutaredoxin domain-containing protein [Verrucomicrobiota bacterium]|nr:glutaredoxin domain-containing protein [Verrucomicrobiota bacterium]HNU50974.1 glutaredoxin domain-containing protein [Verrucomicrobiota bacterium]
MKAAHQTVTLYSVPGCELCRRARSFLERHRIRFHEVNAFVHPRAILPFLGRYGRLLPMAVLGPRVVDATDLKALGSLLRAGRNGGVNPPTASRSARRWPGRP